MHADYGRAKIRVAKQAGSVFPSQATGQNHIWTFYSGASVVLHRCLHSTHNVTGLLCLHGVQTDLGCMLVLQGLRNARSWLTSTPPGFHVGDAVFDDIFHRASLCLAMPAVCFCQQC
eukprot:TRINITY_DN11894_c0_g2_i2.p1 TRINITY_DN11894_c0_g2~~TRINITY_DN11894_c0_g2_i2.p1  ORF type:complete len:117 (-),score=7.84 TRINITY_DN11894_c0_g2_i2:246-596(-)